MPVNKSTKATPETPVPETPALVEAPVADKPAEVAQSIALELVKINRWTSMGESRIYEKGTVYDFDPDKAAELLRRVDDAGFPVWRKEQPKMERVRKPDRDLDSETRHEHRERVRVQAANPAPAPAPIATAKNTAPVPIHIPDDDPEIAAKLSKIDADAGDEGGVGI